MTMLALRVVSLACGLLAFRGIRWAYFTYIVLGLLYFPLHVGFEFHPHACQMGISLELAWLSLGNWGHVVLFAIFSVMTMAQFRRPTWRAFAWAAVIVIAMGAAVEIAEGSTGDRNCRLRDLVPDAAGGLIGMVLVAAWVRLRH
jgi:VanZ like family